MIIELRRPSKSDPDWLVYAVDEKSVRLLRCTCAQDALAVQSAWRAGAWQSYAGQRRFFKPEDAPDESKQRKTPARTLLAL